MGKKLSLLGRVFGRLLVVGEVGRTSKRKIVWRCQCECGTILSILADSLLSGHTRSCGCFRKESAMRLGQKKKTHGMYNTPEYHSWRGMKIRCTNPMATQYKYYGGRGIKVCDRWLHSFEKFLGDMGGCPSVKHSIDRIDVNGDYCPENCRWATQKEQASNRRNTQFIAFKGRTLTLTQWAMELNVAYCTLYARIRRGWPIEKALVAPIALKRRT